MKKTCKSIININKAEMHILNQHHHSGRRMAITEIHVGEIER